MLRTLSEWNAYGYKVKKGSKAVAFVDDVAYFSDEQVEKSMYAPTNHSHYPDYSGTNYDEGWCYEGSMEEALGGDFY